MGQHLWNDSQSDQPRFTPIVQQPTNNKPTPLLNYFNTPRVEENNNNWKKQTASFISSSASKIQALSDLKPERESWRQHFSSNEFDRINDPYGTFSAKNPSPYFPSPSSGESASRSLMSLRDFATTSSSRYYQESNLVGGKNRFGSPTSALHQYSNTYLHAKRPRLSPEAPPESNLVGGKNRFGSPTSALHQYSNTYLHAKRPRLSPEAPPVERLF
uniref:Uncharacterized protein n=1 Tax=Meloidogyne incognita TaxID=6306 RepID=A0A914MCB2_MELIC